MKSTKTVLRAALALLLALCCLCGSAVTSFAQTPGGSDDTSPTTITVVYFTYPSNVYISDNPDTIHVTLAPFLTKTAEGFWHGTYDGMDITVTGISAVSKNEDILQVSPAVATDDGWDIAITGVGEGTASVVLTATELFNGETTKISKEVSIESGKHGMGLVPSTVWELCLIDTEAEKGGVISVDHNTVKKGDAVAVTLSAEDGYQLSKLQVYDLAGKLLSEIDYSKNKSKKDTVQLRNVEQGLHLKLIVAKADDEDLSNPFTDLHIEDFENPYTDLSPDDWYYEPVAMMSMAGMLDNIDFEEYLPSAAAAQAAFRPASGAFRVTTLAAADSGPARKAATKRIFGKSVGTRAVTVMELHNAADNLNLTSGSYTKSPFADVKPGKSCFQAVLWAVDKSIVFGYGNGYFGTYDSITREQMCAILLRTAQKSGMTLPQTVEAKNFTDSAAVSSWAQSAVTACAEAGIINGFPDGSFKPKSSIMNGELTTMIYRFLNLLP